MDINSILNNDGYHAPNPEYKKGNGQPKFIITKDPNYAIGSTSSMFIEAAKRGDLDKIGDVDTYKKYIEYGITPKQGENIDDYTRNLADAQSWLEQARNSLVQTISEGTLGTVKAFADLFDLVTLAQLRKDNDYQNPVSAQLEKWQKQIRDNTTIWQDLDSNVLNGGLFDSGFIFNGLPSIISSLTLLIPSKAVTVGVTRGMSFVTRKGLKFARNLEKANRANKIGESLNVINATEKTVAEIEGASKVAKFNAYLNGPASKTAKNVIDYGIGGFTSRLLENYQEARQTFNDSNPIWSEILKNMSPEEREKTINNLKEEFGQDAADWGSYDSIANLVSRKAADETFKADMANTMFDIYQMYSIGKVARAINGPSRAALRRINKNNKKFVGKSQTEIDDILGKRTKFEKFKDKTGDIIIGGKHSILSEFTEGVEEAINYIAQEEGFHYGKVLLGQEEKGDFLSDRLQNYVKAPQLWDAAFWGLVGGVVFNAAGEYANRITGAFDKIRDAKKKAKEQIANNENPIKIPTFKEAFKDTELEIRKENLESNITKYNTTIEKLNRINSGEDVYGLTNIGTLETEEEKNASKDIAIREFRDTVLLEAMDAGNYNYAKDYLASNELKQSFVDSGILTQEQADRTQAEVLTRGDELLKEYNSQLRNIYNSVAGWGEYNDSDLTEIPAEVFNIIARENIHHKLATKYYEDRVNRILKANIELEEDSKEELEKASKENGITDFKSIIENVWKAQSLGIINAEIEDIQNNKQHVTPAGQAVLRNLKLRKKILEDELLKNAYNEGIVNVEGAANVLLTAKSISSVELLPYKRGEQHTYQVNEANENYKKLSQAIENRDEKIIKELAPIMKSVLSNKQSNETDTSFLEDVINRAEVLDQTMKTLYNSKGEISILKNINSQLDSNYRELAAMQINALFEKSQVNSTREQIASRANDIMNELNIARAEAIESSSHLYQQLAKRYGKQDIINELTNYIKTGEHTEVFNRFNDDEKSAFNSYTQILKLNKPSQDIVIKDIVNALNYNDIYEYSRDKDIIEIIREQKRKRAEQETQKNNTSQNLISEQQNQTANDNSESKLESNATTLTGQIDNFDNQNQTEKELSEGLVNVDDNQNIGNGNTLLDTETVKNLSDEDLNTAINSTRELIADVSIPDNLKQEATANLPILEEEQKRRTGESQISSTGEPLQTIESIPTSLDKSDVVVAVTNLVKDLSTNNPENIDINTLKEKIATSIKQQSSELEDDFVNDLVESVIPIVNRKLKKEGDTIESALAKGIVRLSRIPMSDKSNKAVNEAKALLNKTFDDLLDIFNRRLSKGKVNGKYVIPLEPLIRYARKITNNEFEAQEMYNAFTKIIAENPEKYVTIQGKIINPIKTIENITMSVTDRIKSLNNSIGGRTLNIMDILDKANPLDRINTLKAIKNLKPGSKLYITPNYDNEKIKDKKLNEVFIGGFDIIAITPEGEKVLISKLPTPSFGVGGKNNYTANLDGWYYTFPLANQKGKSEYPIQRFFKDLFISDDELAVKFRDLLALYESYTQKEAYNENIGEKTIKEAYAVLEEFAKKYKYNLNDFVQYYTKDEYGNAKRIRHLAKLDYYTQNKWALDLESADYNESDKNLRIKSFTDSINLWFDKLIESSDSRHAMTDILEKLELKYNPNFENNKNLYDIGVEVESVGKPKLIRTKEENALPISEGIADQHKDDIHLAAGDLNNRTQIIVSNGKPINLGGEDTTGRSIVVLTAPNGNPVLVPAYPARLQDDIFENNVKLAAFKEALTTKLFELMDDWYENPDKNSEALELFLDYLGHKTKERRKSGISLFAGFSVNYLPNGNGFSIVYKTSNGNVLSPTSKENGEYHYLTFYNKVSTKHGKKARAAVQDYVKNENNPAIVWNSNPRDTSLLQQFNNMKNIIKHVVIDSLVIRIDPTNINADNNSKINYGNFIIRDDNGNLALKVSGIKKPSNNLKQYYYESTGDIIITNLGKDGKAGNFSDFILFNDVVKVTTKQIAGSNFNFFDNSDGDFGITYAIRPIAPSIIKETVPQQEVNIKLSDTVKELLSNKRNSRTNYSKAIIKEILNRIADANSSLYQLTKNSQLLNKFLHKNVIFVENFNGASYTEENETKTVPEDAYAANIPIDTEFTINGNKITVKGGSIVVGNNFMELLDGDTYDMIDALHQLLHENVHAFIVENEEANPESKKYKKELTDLWEEYSRKSPNSPHSNNNPSMDLEEFIVESLTNIDLIKELNSIKADNPLNNERKPKSLLGKLLDKLISWLSDVLGNDFKINKDSLFSKEYAIFEEVIINNNNNSNKIKKEKIKTNTNKKSKKQTYTEGILDFDFTEDTQTITEIEEKENNENNNSEIDELDGFTISISKKDNKNIISQDNREEAPDMDTIKIRHSKIKMSFPTLRGALDNVSGDTYFDIVTKINNGIITIKCK